MPDPLLCRIAPAKMPEWMDAPTPLTTMRGCLRSLEQVNRLTGSYKPILNFLGRALARATVRELRFTEEEPLRILDLGSGGGDTLVRIGRWAAIRNISVELVGVDLNPQSAALARETEMRRTSRRSRLRPGPIRWVTGDALALSFDPAPHIIVSSLFFHHLEDADIVRVLRWQHDTALLGWLASDLVRSARAAVGFGLLASALKWHPFVRHDGPVSFQRAFRSADWARYLQQAAIPPKNVRVRQVWPARLCVEHIA